ncbi:MAG: hypothetical protein LIP18_01475, partial [Planctomycetes bacterium]|nr:hypothetical protein [Planctomycetota bacterium]
MEEHQENPLNGDAGTPPPLPPDAAPQFDHPPAPSAPPAGDGPYSFGAEPGQAAGGGEYSSPASAPVNRGSIRAGDVFSRSWNLLAKNPGLYIGLAVIPAVPSFIGDVLGTGLSGSLFQIISSCLGLVLQAAIAYAVYRSMSGDGTTMGEACNKGMKRFLPVLGASILLGILTGVGYMLLVVPGLIITCVYIVTIPVCAVE